MLDIVVVAPLLLLLTLMVWRAPTSTYAGQAPEPEVTFGAEPKLVLKLAETVEIYGWVGSQRQARVIGVEVDEPDTLAAQLEPHSGMNEPPSA